MYIIDKSTNTMCGVTLDEDCPEILSIPNGWNKKTEENDLSKAKDDAENPHFPTSKRLQNTLKTAGIEKAAENKKLMKDKENKLPIVDEKNGL